jgi:hypothetical protein
MEMNPSLKDRIVGGLLALLLTAGGPALPLYGMQCGPAEDPVPCECDGGCCEPEHTDGPAFSSVEPACCLLVRLDSGERDQAATVRPSTLEIAAPLAISFNIATFVPTGRAETAFRRSGGPPGPFPGVQTPILLSTLRI